MLFGYYDTHGYPNMYVGPANKGDCPLNNSVWDTGETPISASHIGIDGRTVKGSVEDYWTEYGSSSPDPYIGNWPEHSSDSTTDFMGTSQSKYGLADGVTRFYTTGDGSPRYDGGGNTPDGCHGMRLYAEWCHYTVVTNFTQYIAEGPMGKSGGFTFSDFTQEIDAGRPVLIHLVGHTMLAYGYDTNGEKIYVHDTWDYKDHSMAWGGTYPYYNMSLQHYAVTVLRLAPAGPAYTITSSVQGGNGTLTPLTQSVSQGSSASVAIAPTVGYRLSALTDNGAPVSPLPAGTSYTIPSVTSDHTVIGSFAVNTYALTVNVSGSGTVAKFPDQSTYTHGATVQLTATSSPGWTFTGWSGNLTGTANPSVVTMDATKTVTATFALAPVPATVSFGPSLTPGLVLNAGQTLDVPLLLAGDLEHAAYLDLYLEWYSLTDQGFTKITTVQTFPLSASQTYTWHIPADLVADTAYLTASVWRNDGTNGGAGSYSVVRSGVMIVTPSGSVATAVASPVAGVIITGPSVPVTLHLGNLVNPWGNILEVWFSPSGAPGSFVKVYHTETGFASTMTPTVDLSFLGSGTWTACHFAVTVYVGGTTWRTNYSPTFTLTNP